MFTKYSSIDNSYTQATVNRFQNALSNSHMENKIYVSEKRHGANFCFIASRDCVLHASRNGVISGNDFYDDYKVIVEKYEEQIKTMFTLLRQLNPNVESINAYGEMFGGYHPNPPKKYDRKRINKGVVYTSDVEYEVFDILLRFVDGSSKLLSQQDMYFFCESVKIPTVPLIGVFDTLGEALGLDPNNIPPAPLDMYAKTEQCPPVENNYAEGYVIKPNLPLFLANGDRAILKVKSKAFLEKRKERIPVEKKEIPDVLKGIIEEMSQYITEHRLDNVISKDGCDPRDNMKHFGKCLSNFTKDAIDDFCKDNPQFLEMEKSEQKIVTKEMAEMCAKFLKGVVGLLT